MKKAVKSYGEDATSGQDEGDGETNPDTSNYGHIESFVNDLQHPHELEHAMYHAAKRLHENESKNPSDETKNLDSSSTGSEHDMTQPISIEDFKRLKDM